MVKWYKNRGLTHPQFFCFFFTKKMKAKRSEKSKLFIDYTVGIILGEGGKGYESALKYEWVHV